MSRLPCAAINSFWPFNVSLVQNGFRMEWFIFWLGVNFLVGYAIGKPKNAVAECVLFSILLGPIGWIIAAVSRGNVRRCPFCAEDVASKASVCKHCGQELPVGSAVRASPIDATPRVPKTVDTSRPPAAAGITKSPPAPAKPRNTGGAHVFVAILGAAAVIGLVLWLRNSVIQTQQAERNLQNQIERTDIMLHLLNKGSSPSLAGTPRPRPSHKPAALSPSTVAQSTPSNSPRTVEPTLASHDPNVVTLTRDMSMKIPYGIVGLRAGSKFRAVSQNGDTVRIRYSDGADYDIPIGATDWK